MTALTYQGRRRKEALLLLAGSLYDYMAAPKGMSIKTGKGQAATHYEPFLDCGGAWLEGERTRERVRYRKGTGVRKDPFKRDVPCERCGGHRLEDGSIRPGKGEVAMDRMTGSQVGTERTYAPPPRDTWPCNFCLPLDPKAKRGTGWNARRNEACRACWDPEEGRSTGIRRGSKGLKVRQSDPSDPPDPEDVVLSAVERGISRRDAAGSYHELDVCLAELARRSPHRHRVFHAVYVAGVLSAGLLSGTEADLLRAAVTDLLAWMPSSIRVPAEIVEASRRKQPEPKGRGVTAAALADRDERIRERYERGERTADIAAEIGLSVSQVQRVLNKEAA